MKLKLLMVFLILPCVLNTYAGVPDDDPKNTKEWKSPPEEILNVLNAPELPWVWTSPSGKHLLLADPILYPSLEELGSPMLKLAGIRLNPANNSYHGWHGGKSPRIVEIENGNTINLEFPSDAEILEVAWTADGKRFALTTGYTDRIELWVGSVNGDIQKIKNITLNPLISETVSWLPDQKRLLVRSIPDRGEAPKPPAIPIGPKILEGEGATARSTYEARNLLETAHDDALFDYFTQCELAIVDPDKGKIEVIGKAASYSKADFSPDGQYILVERMVRPWSHEVAYWRFAKEIEVWNEKGELIKTIASLPLADAVPIHGERQGPRSVSWRPTAEHTLYWVEALDGGDPVAEVTHRDRLMYQEAPFRDEPEEIFRAKHRIQTWSFAWSEEGGTLLLAEHERMKRWRYVWLLDVDEGSSRMWFDLDESDRYNDPGSPVFRKLANGKWVMRQKGNAVYFKGSGATEQGDRPFLDLRDLETGESKRLYRCDTNHYENFVAFAGDEDQFILRSESVSDVPNYYLLSFNEEVEAAEGEATMSVTRKPITHFTDPTPELRQIEKRIVKYQRKDSVPLSFELLLPPGYEEGTPIPTVVYAYPLEYASASTAGQVRGSSNRFMRLWGASHLYFLLQGYAVLDQTAMPMIGDPETTYNTFVEQLVADAEAAVDKAVEIGVADPNKIGIIGHSHGGLMVANLLAHTDLFKAGIARSGSYNKTNQPFGFQSERRSLFEARDVYIQVSPTFFADKVNEPILIIHGNDDSNPGTLTYQSEVFFEAVKGSGGTARLVLLPFEDHGYRARESIEHVLWEQLRWFNKYLKGSEKD